MRLNDDKPIFQQIKEQIEEAILNDSLIADSKAPSTNELATFYKINPATAAKGMNELVTEEILYKRRGIGMFVTSNAKEILLNKRKSDFYKDYIQPLKREAIHLGIGIKELQSMIEMESGIDEN